MPFLRFSDERAFIKVVNTQTNVVSHINKNGLLIQKNNEDSFLLKNDSFYGFYKLSDVETSETTVDGLIDVLVQFVQDFAAGGDSGSSADRSAERMIDIRSNFKFSTADSILTEKTENATTAFEADKAMTRLQTSTDAGSRVVRQSQEYIPNGFVTNVISMQEAVLNAGETEPEGVVSRVGVFEDREDLTVNTDAGGRGAFFEYDLSEKKFALALRTNDGSEQTDNRVEQENWNIDRLDGAGRSGITLDAKVKTLFVFEWDPIKVSLRCGILVGDSVTFCHEFSEQPIKLMNAPLRWEVAHTGEEAPSETASVLQGQASVFHTEDPKLHTRGVTMGPSEMKTVTENSKPMLSLTLKEPVNRAKLALKGLTVLNTAAGGVGKWEIVRNATLSDEDFQDIEGSVARFSTAETDAQDGTVVASGYLFDTGVTKVALDDHLVTAMADVAGVPETLTLRIVHVEGAMQILAGVEWSERE